MSVSSHPFLFHMLYITSSNFPHSSSKTAGSTGFPERPRLCTGSHLSFTGPRLEKQKLNSNQKFTRGCCSSFRPDFLGRFSSSLWKCFRINLTLVSFTLRYWKREFADIHGTPSATRSQMLKKWIWSWISDLVLQLISFTGYTGCDRRQRVQVCAWVQSSNL